MEFSEILEQLKGYDYPFLLSKLLGIGMALGSCFSKLPIFINIFRIGYCEGLSPVSLYLELSAYLASIVYNTSLNNAISTYGDIAALAFQFVLLIILVWLLGVQKDQKLSVFHRLLAFLTILLFAYGILFLVPKDHVEFLIIYSIIISLFAKVPQLLRNYKNKNTGVLSMITAITSIAGPLVKMYITIVETKDPLIFVYALLTFALNSVLLLQILIYGKRKIE